MAKRTPYRDYLSAPGKEGSSLEGAVGLVEIYHAVCPARQNVLPRTRRA